MHISTHIPTTPPVAQEATRLRRLGYSWETAFEMAELIVAVNGTGLFLAMVPEDYMDLNPRRA